ncbi:hypothetical protein C0Q70_04889 [Pomacea canaliculata]|uniref:Uncharacterized protein n=1 Tax=Pomacea canaliculata TaxID=400727 RepID=A0A2T7PJM4_POMCA|nr:hypothetical protein C0Q70_04889 [Pomacea canaliculata]
MNGDGEREPGILAVPEAECVPSGLTAENSSSLSSITWPQLGQMGDKSVNLTDGSPLLGSQRLTLQEHPVSNARA